MSTKSRKITISMPYAVLALIALCMMLTACDLHEESTLNTTKMRLEESSYAESFDVRTLDEKKMYQIVRHYEKHGDGPLQVTVSYDPQSRTSNAMHASDHAARIASYFRKKGLPHIESGIMPVVNSGSDMKALIAFDSYVALGPAGCEAMGGTFNHEEDLDNEYRLGCTRDMLFARQLARPSDLKGRNISPTTDGRRVANSTETYRTGIPNEPLVGESASGDE